MCWKLNISTLRNSLVNSGPLFLLFWMTSFAKYINASRRLALAAMTNGHYTYLNISDTSKLLTLFFQLLEPNLNDCFVVLPMVYEPHRKSLNRLLWGVEFIEILLKNLLIEARHDNWWSVEVWWGWKAQWYSFTLMTQLDDLRMFILQNNAHFQKECCASSWPVQQYFKKCLSIAESASMEWRERGLHQNSYSQIIPANC